jgi:hypothetical protein
MPEKNNNEDMDLKAISSSYVPDADDIDLSLLKDSLAKSAWERMQANDDALNFAESLRAAMNERHARKERHARLKPTDAKTH